MNTGKFADEILVFLYKHLSKNGITFSTADFVATQFSNASRADVLKALGDLRDNGLVSVSYADDEINKIKLNPLAMQKLKELL